MMRNRDTIDRLNHNMCKRIRVIYPYPNRAEITYRLKKHRKQRLGLEASWPKRSQAKPVTNDLRQGSSWNQAVLKAMSETVPFGNLQTQSGRRSNGKRRKRDLKRPKQSKRKSVRCPESIDILEISRAGDRPPPQLQQGRVECSGFDECETPSQEFSGTHTQ